MKRDIKKVKEILFKLANGFSYSETTEEFAPIKGENEKEELKLCKKKISTHYVPPDMLAIKMLLEDTKENINSLSNMTDEELVSLKNKLILELNKDDGL